jgi:hypothetical protein
MKNLHRLKNIKLKDSNDRKCIRVPIAHPHNGATENNKVIAPKSSSDSWLITVTEPPQK